LQFSHGFAMLADGFPLLVAVSCFFLCNESVRTVR
jgi:hypothetical protein